MGLYGDGSSNFDSQIGTRDSKEEFCEDGFQHLAKVQPMSSERARVVVCKVSKFYASSEKVQINRLDIKPLVKKKLHKTPNVHQRVGEFTIPRRRELMNHRTFSNPLDYSSDFSTSLSSGSESSELKPNNRTHLFAALFQREIKGECEIRTPPQSIFKAEPEISENSVQKPLYHRVGKVIRNNFKYFRSKSLQSFSAKLSLTSI